MPQRIPNHAGASSSAIAATSAALARSRIAARSTAVSAARHAAASSPRVSAKDATARSHAAPRASTSIAIGAAGVGAGCERAGSVGPQARASDSAMTAGRIARQRAAPPVHSTGWSPTPLASTAAARASNAGSLPAAPTNMIDSGRPRSSTPLGTAIAGRSHRLASGV